MDSICFQYLTGTLSWTGSTSPFTSRVKNSLPVPVYVDYVPNAGAAPVSYSGYPALVGSGSTLQVNGGPTSGPPAGYFKATVAATGGLVAVFALSSAPSDVTLDWTLLNAPNDIGPIPAPTASLPGATVEPQPAVPRANSTIIVPPDGARILVGCGKSDNLNLVVREQFWVRQNDSICLAGNESKTVSYTVTSGTQQISSSQDTLSTSLGGSVSGGWGPISASISASLSKNSTRSQQLITSQEVTSYVSTKITNKHDEPIAFIRWQLTDVVTVLDKDTLVARASIIQLQNPTVVMGPYWINPRQQPELGPGAGLFTYEST